MAFWQTKRVEATENTNSAVAPTGMMDDRSRRSELNHIVSTKAGWKPLLRISVGGLLVCGFLTMSGAKWLENALDRQDQSPLLQHLNEIAGNLFESDTSAYVLASTAIDEAERLPMSGVTGVFRSDALGLLTNTGNVVLSQELPNLTNVSFGLLSCSPDALDCRGEYWGIDAAIETSEDQGQAKFLARVQMEQVFGDGISEALDRCSEVPVIAAAREETIAPEALKQNVSQWIAAGEACRLSLESALRDLTKQTEQNFERVEAYQQEIERVKRANDLDELEQLLRIAPVYNASLSSYAENVALRDTYCYAAKLLGTAYLTHSGDAILSRNQNEAAVVISAAFGLLSCTYRAALSPLNYEWPLQATASDGSLIEPTMLQPTSPSDPIVSEATEVWESEGFEVLDVICEEKGEHLCVEGVGETACYGLQMLRKPLADDRWEIAFASAPLQSILATVSPEAAEYIDQDANFDNSSVEGFYCAQRPFFTPQGRLEAVALKYVGAPDGRVYLRQNDPVTDPANVSVVSGWQAANDPRFPEE